MKSRITKKSVVAIFTAFMFALLVLCASASLRPATARADTGDTITIITPSTNLDYSSDTVIWAELYIGLGFLETAKWKKGSEEGTVTFGKDASDTTITHINGMPVTKDFHFDECPLAAEDDHMHCFTGEACVYTPIEPDTDDEFGRHYAKCSECDFELEVSHRPDGTGVCLDCKEPLYDTSAYTNTYTFTIPDDCQFNYTNDGNELSIDIELTANLLAGYTLELYVACENCELLSEDNDSAGYELTVSCDGLTYAGDDPTFPDIDNPLTPNSNPQRIWAYETPVPAKYDPDELMTDISGTITLTLIVTTTYPGTYTETLTFSANLVRSEDSNE